MNEFKKVLITGATGFIGSNLVKALAREKREVHVIVRASSDLSALIVADGIIHQHIYDGTLDCLLRILKEVQPKTVFHLASQFIAQHQTAQVDSLLENNVKFPSQLLEAMAVCGVKELVNTGTSWQYFASKQYRPVNLYAATKQAFEDILAYYVDAYEWKAVTLNLFDTYGPKDSRPKLIKMLLNTAITKQELKMSPGEQLIDLVHVNDVIDAFLKAGSLLNEMPSEHRRYGVSSNEPIQLKELVSTCERAWGMVLPVYWGALPYRKREVMQPWTAYQSVPGWQPKIPLLDGLEEIFKE